MEFGQHKYNEAGGHEHKTRQARGEVRRGGPRPQTGSSLGFEARLQLQVATPPFEIRVATLRSKLWASNGIQTTQVQRSWRPWAQDTPSTRRGEEGGVLGLGPRAASDPRQGWGSRQQPLLLKSEKPLPDPNCGPQMEFGEHKYKEAGGHGYRTRQA